MPCRPAPLPLGDGWWSWCLIKAWLCSLTAKLPVPGTTLPTGLELRLQGPQARFGLPIHPLWPVPVPVTTRRWHRCVAASTWGGSRKLAGQSLSARTARLRQGRLGRGEVAAGPMGPPGEKRQAEESLGNWRTGEDCVEVLGPPHFTLVSSYFKTLGSLLFYYGSFEILFGEGTV